MKQDNTLRNTALTLVGIAVETRNYITDVLHHIKASGVAEIVAAHESGNPPDITAVIERHAIPNGGRVYDETHRKHITDGCAEVAGEITTFSISQERCAETLVQQLIFWEVEHTPLYDDTFERRFPEEFRETAFYNQTRDMVFKKLCDMFYTAKDVNRAEAYALARYHAFDTAEKHCLIVWMLTRHGCSADEIAPLFKPRNESAREFCEFVKSNSFE